MDKEIIDKRKKIFWEELNKLREDGYLSSKVLRQVSAAYREYYLDKEKVWEISHQSSDSLEYAPDEKELPLLKPEPKPAKTKPVKSIKEKKIPSQEEIRERNITWSLNIGVIFLLIGGLFVATSNWATMTSVMKSTSIAAVAVLFLGIALLSRKVLHIDKTAFAFNVLGSLFLPIFILSLGWFGLLGSYLTVDGPGKNFLGLLVSILPILVYIYFAKTLQSRLFVWFSFISVSAAAAFLIAAFNLEQDSFYLGIMLLNAVLIYGYHRLKGRESIKLFTKELFSYTQVNLVLSTLFMLFLFQNEVQYGFNLLLTAVIYLSMIFVTGRKEYHFVFTVILVYGAYQLIEHSFLSHFSALLYAGLGAGFLFIPKSIKEKTSLELAFQYTSAVISALAFIYISLEGMLVRMGSPSFVLFLAYIVITANFLYLSNIRAGRLFPYLSSFFAASSLYELVQLADHWIIKINFAMGFFIAGFSLFILLGTVKLPKTNVIKESSRDVGSVIMLLSLFAAAVLESYLLLGVMFLLFSFISFILFRLEKRKFYSAATEWILPVSLGLSVAAFGEKLNTFSLDWDREFSQPANLTIAAIILMMSSRLWKKSAFPKFFYPSNIVSYIFITIGMLFVPVDSINEVWVQPLIFAIGIAMYYILHKQAGVRWLCFLLSGLTLILYYSLFQSFDMFTPLTPLGESMVVPFGPITLLIISLISRKTDRKLSESFAWAGQIIYPLSLALICFGYPTDREYSLFIAFLVYGASVYISKQEWSVKSFLYASFTMVFLTIEAIFDSMNIPENRIYDFPATALLIFTFWLFSSKDFKKRTIYYLVPFSLIGIGACVISYPFDYYLYIEILVFGTAILIFLHRIKWDLLNIVVLFLVFIGTIEFTIETAWGPFEKMLLAGGLGAGLALIGRSTYKSLYESHSEMFKTKLDGYTIISFLFYGLMYYFDTDAIWTIALPGILISLTIWMQRNRVYKAYSFLVPVLSGGYLLQPYYSTLKYMHIPSIWEREAIVLPWIVLMIFCRRVLRGRFAVQMNSIQWVVLIAAAASLIEDALKSSTVYDAMILGTLSLVSMLAGMAWRIKAYFFTGSGVLLLNLFLQTRPYWGNMPWWGYLLAAGSILIVVASYNEWHKQKSAKGEATFISIWKNTIMPKLKEWN
ncbi:hypothetical protein [Neobacillus terrae]|uniref:hypothetical protein n=1 Tax=Neobacillus terrae TaxID=3034837 RepID=UPI00140C7510|nr:hypothetical protein [Neobacillus terrae]NHM31071.1 hypothetical protein [Neobacillus terrae]